MRVLRVLASPRVAALAALLALPAGPATAAVISGEVRDADGEPLAGAMVRVDPPQATPGALTVTVFTGADGRYRADLGERSAAGRAVRVSLIGHAVRGEAPGPLAASDGPHRVDFTLEPVDNIAGQVPASAWLQQSFPDDTETLHALWICSGCHQLPDAPMQNYARLTRQFDTQGRINAWSAMVKYMRVKTFDLGPEGSAWPGLPYEVKSDPALSGYDLQDEALIASALGRHLPTDYSRLEHYDPGAPLGVTPDTVIREYQMPREGFAREVGLSARSPYAWGAEQNFNRLVRLDPATGELKDFKVPFDKASGPHTILDDDAGNLWVTSIENDLLMRFDPETAEWTLYQDFGAGALIHDVAYDSNYQVGFDRNGFLWATLIGQNRVGGLNPETRETVAFDAPQPEGRTAIHTALYGIVMDSARERVWYAQLGGGVGSFNVLTREFETHIEFDMGEGPRRLAIDERDRIYVPLMGASEVFVYDTRAGREIARVPLPERWAATYNVTWDPWRQCLWVGTTNADAIYRMDPETFEFTRFPLPRKGAFLRMITFDRHTANLWTAYSATGDGDHAPDALVEIDPGDGVRPPKPDVAVR